MANPIVHSAISIRIVLAFLEFLSSVQSTVPGANTEELENLKQSLMKIFNINASMVEASPKVSLINIFNSSRDEHDGSTSDSSNTDVPMPRRSFSIGSATQIGLSLVQLFHEFHKAVAAVGFFDSSFGEDYRERKFRAKQIFKDAIGVLTRAGYQSFNSRNLADTLKILGNKAMHDTCYGKAVEMYSCALALWKDNAVYFCNRAAAFTKIGRFNQAIIDCYGAIKLEPRYVLAYYRLGCAYYEQGKNLEAIREGFIKVLQLDPHYKAAMVSLQLAESKLRDEVAWMGVQIDSLRRYGVIPMTDTRPATRQSTVLVFRGPEEGGHGPWELVEEMGGASDEEEEDTVSVADFIDMHARYTAPPE